MVWGGGGVGVCGGVFDRGNLQRQQPWGKNTSILKKREGALKKAFFAATLPHWKKLGECNGS